MSRLGTHIVIGPRNGYGEFLTRIANSNTLNPVPIKVVDDMSPAQHAKDVLGERCLTIGRFNRAKDANGNSFDMQAYEPLTATGQYVSVIEVARWYYGLVRPIWEQHRSYIDVFESMNEFSAHWGWQADFYVAMMDLADIDGFKLAHYSCSTGNPSENIVADPKFINCMRETKRRGHYLSLHQYGGVGTNIKTLRGTEPFHALRHRALYNALPEDARPNLLLTEVGQAGGFDFLGTEILMSDMAWYDSELVKDTYVKGATIFTLGKWNQVNYQEALPQLAEYIATHPHKEDNMPESRRYDKTVVLYHGSQYNPLWTNPAVERRLSVTQSADDVTIRPSSDSPIQVGDLRIIVVNPSLWGSAPTIRDWLFLYQSNITSYHEVTAAGSAELASKLDVILNSTPLPTEKFWLDSPVQGIPFFITDRFNSPRNYANGKHEGVDIRCFNFTTGQAVPVVAAQDGIVVKARIDNTTIRDYGNYIVLSHLDPKWGNHRYYTWYCHMDSLSVTEGRVVKRGDVLGVGGKTDTDSIHLHFNLQDVGHGLSGYYVPDVIDPEPWFRVGTTPPPVAWNGIVGLHGRADGGPLRQIDLSAGLTARIVGNARGGYKLYKNAREDYAQLKNLGVPVGNIVVRLDHPPARKTADFYFSGNGIGIWELVLAEAYTAGVRRFELFNEPNLAAEGLGTAWLNVSDFALLFNAVADRIRAKYPDVFIITPGLSPQPNTPTWWNGFRDFSVFSRANGLGCHSYWSGDSTSSQFPMDSITGGRSYRGALPYLQHCRAGAKIWITEASNNQGVSTDTQKGQEYARFVKTMEPQIAGVFFFVVSSSDVGDGSLYNSRRETWVRGNTVSAIAPIFGANWL